MIQKSEGIILKNVKYGENQLITTIFSKQEGVQTFFLRNAFGKNNKKYIKTFYLNIIEIEYKQNKSKELQLCKTIESLDKSLFINSNIYHNSISIFISEILFQVLKNYQQDLILYEFLKKSIYDLHNLSSNFGDFSWIFLLELTNFLGFFPNFQTIDKNYFDLQQGFFSDEFSINSLTKNQTLILKQMLFSLENKVSNLNQNQKKEALNIMLFYYKYHVVNFKQPKSIEIFQEIFS